MTDSLILVGGEPLVLVVFRVQQGVILYNIKDRVYKETLSSWYRRGRLAATNPRRFCSADVAM